MRHKKSFNHLGRKTAHRKAMLSNMATSLIMNKRIKTTTAKAKALRSYIEPLLTKAKDDTTHSRRIVFSYLQDKDAVSELFREIALKISDRPGGYTRILKIGNRSGDNADMAIIELVDYNENLLSEKASTKTTSRRRRRSGAAKNPAEENAVPTADAMVEDAKLVEDESKTEAADKTEVKSENVVKEEKSKETTKEENKSAEEPKKED